VLFVENDILSIFKYWKSTQILSLDATKQNKNNPLTNVVSRVFCRNLDIQKLIGNGIQNKTRKKPWGRGWHLTSRIKNGSCRWRE